MHSDEDDGPGDDKDENEDGNDASDDFEDAGFAHDLLSFFTLCFAEEGKFFVEGDGNRSFFAQFDAEPGGPV